MKLSKKHIIFIIAVFFLIVSIIYRLLNPFVQPEVNTLTFNGEKDLKTGKVEHAGLKAEKLELQTPVLKFLNKPKVSAKVYKDLFSTYKPPTMLAKKKKSSVNVDEEVQKGQKPEIIKESIQEVKEYISSYRVYGTYKDKNTKAVFLAKNKLVLVAKIGDRLDGKYLINDIQDNYIGIKALELNETIHLDMREFNNE